MELQVLHFLERVDPLLCCLWLSASQTACAICFIVILSITIISRST